jgi:hypothetical protein
MTVGVAIKVLVADTLADEDLTTGTWSLATTTFRLPPPYWIICLTR